MSRKKIIIYQVLPRLFGNEIRTCQPWGDRNTNGCGKMDSFTPQALHNIASLGVTHIWYTGLLEHATGADYSIYGIGGDSPEVVKGLAGSPYAIRDYYDIDPD
ncbi:MAG: alpha-amylase, partial [Prevotellaceae bacterium]|nr:alpha-amylase [Prevotellaceae bacterium]